MTLNTNASFIVGSPQVHQLDMSFLADQNTGQWVWPLPLRGKVDLERGRTLKAAAMLEQMGQGAIAVRPTETIATFAHRLPMAGIGATSVPGQRGASKPRTPTPRYPARSTNSG
jgi:hypothetical protein